MCPPPEWPEHYSNAESMSYLFVVCVYRKKLWGQIEQSGGTSCILISIAEFHKPVSSGSRPLGRLTQVFLVHYVE